MRSCANDALISLFERSKMPRSVFARLNSDKPPASAPKPKPKAKPAAPAPSTSGRIITHRPTAAPKTPVFKTLSDRLVESFNNFDHHSNPPIVYFIQLQTLARREKATKEHPTNCRSFQQGDGTPIGPISFDINAFASNKSQSET